MLNWFLGLAGIIMGVAIGQAVTNGTEGQRDTGRKFVLESFFSGSVPPAATSCYVSNGDMKYCMGADAEAGDIVVGSPDEATKLIARRSDGKNGLTAYGLGMRASNDETLWLKGSDTAPVTTGGTNTRHANARSTWSMAGGKNKFFISYNIQKNWFSDNEVVGKLMAAKIARSSANVIGVAFSTGDGVKETVYWEYGKDDATDLPVSGSSAVGLFEGPSKKTGSSSSTSFSEIVPGVGTKDTPVITVLYEL